MYTNRSNISSRYTSINEKKRNLIQYIYQRKENYVYGAQIISLLASSSPGKVGLVWIAEELRVFVSINKLFITTDLLN